MANESAFSGAAEGLISFSGKREKKSAAAAPISFARGNNERPKEFGGRPSISVPGGGHSFTY